MSCWKLVQAESGKTFHPAECRRRPADGAQDVERVNDAPISCRPLIFVKTLCALFLVYWGADISRAQQPDLGVYARAVEFCRGRVKRPMVLDLDRRVLCFDGAIFRETDVSLAGALEPNGLFVVRSFGGDAFAAMALADTIRDRRANVVVYDYCLSACASFFLVASDETFVMKDTVVAWHHAMVPLCTSLEVPKDGGPKRLEKSACSDTTPEYQWGDGEFKYRSAKFYETRVIHPPFEHPPESFTIRKILRSMFEGIGRYPDVLWTWHPRYYPSMLKTKIVYEAYPNNQAEVDALTSKFHLSRTLYDP
jgi:hypothetical protein